MGLWLALYGLVFLLAFVVSGLLCAVARAVGLRLGLMDWPSGRKAHERPVAVTGGWGIFVTFVLIVGVGTVVGGWLAERLPGHADPLRAYMSNIAGIWPRVGAVVGGAALIFAVGAVDDLRPLGPRLKLAAQVIGALALLPAGIAIKGFLPMPLGWGLTVLWIVLLTNAFNLMDNMDGLCASVGLVICVVLALAAWGGAEMWLPALFLCLAGALGGFLLYNFSPASMFMGDAGSMSVGYLLGVFSILITYYERGVPSGLPILMPVAIMGVPLFDTISVMFIRWRAGKPLMVGDRNHFSHRLLAMGFGVRAAAVTIAALTGAVGLLALALRHLGLTEAVVHVVGLVLLFGVIVALELVGRRAGGNDSRSTEGGS